MKIRKLDYDKNLLNFISVDLSNFIGVHVIFL